MDTMIKNIAAIIADAEELTSQLYAQSYADTEDTYVAIDSFSYDFECEDTIILSVRAVARGTTRYGGDIYMPTAFQSAAQIAAFILGFLGGREFDL